MRIKMTKRNKKTNFLSGSPKNLVGRMVQNVSDNAGGVAGKVHSTVGNVVGSGKKIVSTVVKSAVAVNEAKMNMVIGKSLRKTVSDFTETMKADSIKELQDAVVKHQRNRQELDSVLSAASPVARSLVGALESVFCVVDARKENGYVDEMGRKYARFAAHSYDDLEDDVLPCGFEIIDFKTTYENLRARTYSDGNEIVCAFAGTGTSLRDWKDWENNATQLFGVSKQYEEALAYAKSLCERYPGKGIVFVGHSKGGGEAAYCAYNLGMQAETYNPAALSFLTKHKLECKKEVRINAYVFSTDILNKLQSRVGMKADGDVKEKTAHPLEHGFHGITGILKYYKIKYTKKKQKRRCVLPDV